MSRRITKAEQKDLPQILERYAEARAFMAQAGNPDQWGRTGYPQEELLREDIALGRLYAVCEDDTVIGAFVLVFGDDPTYLVIENGAWLNAKPYGTLHRICSGAGVHGVAKLAFDFCKSECRKRGADLRADTHANNTVMHHVLKREGFVPCGTIYVADGSPKTAYHLALN